jgi:hypothetical protein
MDLFTEVFLEIQDTPFFQPEKKPTNISMNRVWVGDGAVTAL